MSAIKTLGGLKTIFGASSGSLDAIVQILITAFPKLSGAITAAGAAATAAGGGFAGLAAGAGALLSALSPLTIVAVAIGTAFAGFKLYNNYIDGLVDSAKQAGDAWEQSNTSIQDNISKITELRTALDSGKLTEQEAYDAKSQLLDIQNQLSESYGSQAEGIDLVNGSLDKQIAKLKELNNAQSERFLNENQKGIEEAQRQMGKERHTYLGQFSPYAQDADKLQNVIDKYADKGVYTESGMDGTVYVHFKGDATQANEVLNDFMTDIRNASDETGNIDLFDGFTQNASAGLNEAKDVLDEYQNLYNQSLKADIQTNKKDYGGKTASEWLNNYAKAVENYNNAVASGSAEEVANAKKYYNDIDSSVQTMLKGSDMSQYSALFTDVSDQLDKAAIKANEFNTALSSDGQEYLNGYQKHLRSVSDEVKNLNMSDVDFKAAINSGNIDSINYLSQAAEQAGISTDDLAQTLVNLGVLSGQSSAAVEEIADSFQSVSDSANTLLSQINAVNSVLSSQSTGKSISIEDFNSDELKDYTSALEYNNGALQLNAEKVRELQKAKAEEAIQTNENQKLEKQSQYMKNIAEIEKLQDELRKLSDAKSENAQAIQNSIDALLSENDGLVNQCNQLDILSASLREATGAYQNWLDKQNTSESGDMFDDAMGALDHIEDTVQNTKSEYYGRIGRESYKAAVEFLVPDTIDGQDAEAVSSYIDSIEHYFNHDSKGNRTGLDVAEFCAKATKAGLMELDEATNEYKILGQRTMEDFAEGLNLSLPMVQAMFGEMEEFNAKFDWSDEAVKTLGDMAMAAGEAKGRIEELSGDKNLDIQIDVSDIERTKDKISTLESTISQMQNYKSTLEVDSSQVDDANAIIQYCVTQKQMLEAPAVMSVDASQVDGEIGNALSLLQQFQTAQNNVELQADVGADTSEAQGKVDSLVGEIQGLSPEIKAQLGIDGTSVATITASIQALTPPELKVRAGVDTTAVDAYAAQEKQSQGKVTWDNNTSAVDAWASQMHVSNGTVNWGNNISAVRTYFTATGTVNWTNTTPPSGGSHGLNGTAHANGTAQYPHLVGHANAKGNWGTKTGGMTLVGELGREIVVNPYTGTWETVGDNGAEFKYIPAGSIVFNHLQSESLLKRGFVNSRGTAKASGTAMVTGGISVNQANIASGRATYGGSGNTQSTQANRENTNSVRENTNSVRENTSSVKENTEAFDWVKRNLDKLSRTFDYYANQINDYISSTLKISLLKKQLSTLAKQIKANQQGYNTYMDKANSINISNEYKNRVKNGTFKIEEIDTSSDAGKKLAENIKKYQEYYDAAMDCRDAVVELRNSQLELFETLANMPTERAENKIEKLKRKYESLSAVSSTVSSGGSAIAVLTDQINKDNPKLKNAKANVTKAENARDKTKTQTLKASKTLKNEKADTEESALNLTKTAKKQTSDSAKSLKKAAKSSTDKATYNAISKAIREGKTVSTKGLKGEALKYAKSYNSSLKQQNKVEKAVSSGKQVSTSGLSKVLKDEASQYNQDVKDQSKAQQAYDKAKASDKKALEKLNEARATKDQVYSQTTKEQQTLATNKNPKAYVVQNSLLDQEVALLKQENTERQKALKDTVAATKKQQAEYDKAVSSRNKSQKNLLSDKKVTSSLNKTQLAALKAGKTISTKGITDPAVLKKIEAYNKKVSTASSENKKLNIQLEAQANAVNNAAQAEAEYAQALVENEGKKLDNISAYYDSILSEFENRNNLVQAYMDRMELQGYSLSESFYQAQIANEETILKAQKAELEEMEKSFQNSVKNGIIKEGTQEYNEMKDTIDQLRASVAEGENSIISLQKAIRDLEWEQFDKLQESIKRVTSESDFLINLLSSKDLYDKETGLLTRDGWATMGLHGVNYNTYMAQADDYYKELQRINAELVNDPNNQELIDRRNELVDLQQQSIIAAENEKKSIRDLVENGIDAELDAVDDLIDKYTKILEEKKNLYEFEKKSKKQTEEIASLQKQLAVYQNDNSEEAKAKIQEIKVSLKEAQDNLKESEYDKFVSDQKDLLDSLRNDYEEVLNKRLDNIDVLIKDVVNQVNENSSEICDTLKVATRNVGYELSNEMKTIWTRTDGVAGVITTYDRNFSTAMTTVDNTLGNIYNRQKSMIDAIDNMAETYIQNANSPNGGETPTTTKTKGYASGGHVGKDQWAVTNEYGQELIEYNGGFLVPLPNTSDIWNAPETKALLNELSNPQPLFVDYTSQFMRNLQSVGGGNGDGQNIEYHFDNVTLNLPNVKNYPEFMNAMVKDRKFEKLVNAITIDKVHGGTKLSKHKISWTE